MGGVKLGLQAVWPGAQQTFTPQASWALEFHKEKT